MSVILGDEFPSFKLKAVVGKDVENVGIDDVFTHIDDSIYKSKNKWLTIFFYPHDFSCLCPSEVAGFNDLYDDFAARNCVLLAVSTDSEFTHWAWRRNQKELNNISIPLLADVCHTLSDTLGVLDKAKGAAKRATFIVDPEGIVRFNMITDDKVARSPSEILRLLDALQTGEMCPCDWQKGDETIDIARWVDNNFELGFYTGDKMVNL